MTKQATKMASVIGHIDSDRLGSKEDNNKRVT